MFRYCFDLTALVISGFDTSSATKTENMFAGCDNLLSLKLGENFGNVAEAHYLKNRKGWVNAKAPSTVISGSGEYAVFSNTGGNTYIQYGTSITQKGDLNNDTMIDGRDATLVLSMYADSSSSGYVPTDADRAVGDVNNDTFIDGRDATIILGYYADLSAGASISFENYLKNNKYI